MTSDHVFHGLHDKVAFISFTLSVSPVFMFSLLVVMLEDKHVKILKEKGIWPGFIGYVGPKTVC